jgi:molybdate transport system ATP-binding protein
VALARALCSHPALLVLDEPLGALDEALRQRILPYLLRLRREFDVPIVYVSHDATEVQALCDEVVVLERGRARARGKPSEVFARAAGGRDFENVLRGRVISATGDTARVEIGPEVELVVPRDELAPAMHCLIGLSARDLLLASQRPAGLSARNVLAGTVADLAPAGEEVGVDVELAPAVRVRANVTQAAVSELALAPGARVFVVAKTHSCRLIACWEAGSA